MDFETIKNNAVNAFRQLSVLRVIVTSPNEKVADVPALYALAALLLAPWVCAAALVLGFLFKATNAFRHACGVTPPSKREDFEPEYTHINTNRDEPFMVRPGFFHKK